MSNEQELLRRLDVLRADVDDIIKGGRMPGDEAAAQPELDVKAFGAEARTKGYRLMDLVWLPMVLGIAWLIMTHISHAADTKDEKAALARALTESNATIAATLKESNAATVQAIREMAAEQRKSTDAIREIACLSDPAIKNRGDAREFCKRMSRDSR